MILLVFKLKLMKHIKRHYQIGVFPKGEPKIVGVTIVGEMNKLPDGTYELKFGAARSSIKDNFTQKVGMKLATERFETHPVTERLITRHISKFAQSFAVEDFAEFVGNNPEYIRIHFKS